jgi:hypothetical protein
MLRIKFHIFFLQLFYARTHLQLKIICCRTNYGYKVVDVDVDSKAERIKLERIDSNSSMFGGDAQHIIIDVVYVSDWLLRIKVCSLQNFSF